MTTDAMKIREAIIARLDGQLWLPVRTVRRQPRPQLQEKNLPALLVVLVDETETPEDEANIGVPRFLNEVTIGISVVVGEEFPAALDADLDDIIDEIRARLLTDPTFVRGVDPSRERTDPERYPLFEAVTKVRRAVLFPQDGAFYFAEGRLEISFRLRSQYDPVITDRYEQTVLTARPAGSDPAAPALRVVLDRAQ